jgi:hypothetical protein
MNAIFAPSGDQAGWNSNSSGVLVMFVTDPPAASTVKRSLQPGLSPSLANTICVPSGDHDGIRAAGAAPLVTFVSSLPSGLTV